MNGEQSLTVDNENRVEEDGDNKDTGKEKESREPYCLTNSNSESDACSKLQSLLSSRLLLSSL
jgi:hypothetical protein